MSIELSKSIGALLTCMGFVSCVAVDRSQAQSITVRGLVTDDAGNPVAGVSVRAEQGAQVVGTTVQSDASGQYVLTVDQVPMFDVIYDHAAMHPDTIRRLSGVKDHDINKVLYPLGGLATQDPFVALEVLQAYERIYLASAVAGELNTEDLQARYGERLQQLQREKWWNGDDEVGRVLTKSARDVFALFKMGIDEESLPP